MLMANMHHAAMQGYLMTLESKVAYPGNNHGGRKMGTAWNSIPGKDDQRRGDGFQEGWNIDFKMVLEYLKFSGGF